MANLAKDCSVQFQWKELWFESRSSLGFFSFLCGVKAWGKWSLRRSAVNRVSSSSKLLIQTERRVQNGVLKTEPALLFRDRCSLAIPTETQWSSTRYSHLSQLGMCVFIPRPGEATSRWGLSYTDAREVRMQLLFVSTLSTVTLFRFCEQHPGGKARRAGCDYCVSPGIFAQKSLSPVGYNITLFFFLLRIDKIL